MRRLALTLRTLLVAVVVTMLLAACGDGGSAALLTDGGDLPGFDTMEAGKTGDLAEPDLAPETTPMPDVVDIEPDDSSPLGQPGDACATGADCVSGACYFGSCAALCADGCPADTTCGTSAEGMEICIPHTVTQCVPCSGDPDCQPADVIADEPILDAWCISYGVEGSYCATTCGADGSCATGYECVETVTAGGVSLSACKRTTGICTCSTYAIQVGAMTSCPVGNEFGSCPGERYCEADGLTECQGDEAEAEVCDGQDNDCDGAIDEGIAFQECAVDNDFGSCVGVLDCADGEEICDAPIPQEESCDKVDNDCDGDVDEDFPDDNGNGILDCLEGDTDDDGVLDYDDNCVNVANPDQADFDEDGLGNLCDKDDDGDGVNDTSDCAPLNPAVSPKAEETCNGIDDDCDGVTDEGFVDSNGDGTADCMEPDTDEDGIFDDSDNCPEIKNPSQQDFDGDELGDPCDDDDDGDGALDEDDCAPLNAAVFPGAQELCNGADDNCNGESDEGFADDNGNGILDCLENDTDEDGLLDADDNCIEVPNPGQEDYDEDAQGDACDADDDNDGELDETDCEPTNEAIYPNADELCNGIDDNCNAAADEGFDDIVCGLGECQVTVAGCVDGEVPECVAGQPVAELCDELDNDCDGEIDEDFPDDNGNGVVDCLEPDQDEDGVPDEDDNCLTVPNPDQADFDGDGMGDACDTDDDGDGSLDEDDCEPLNGAIYPEADELCNGIDDNCGGGIDEGFGEATCGLGECAVTVVECVDGVPQECAAGQPVAELCDQLDNDCDGEVDEDFPDENGNGILDCFEVDADGDGIYDMDDNCPETPNPEQLDFDNDNAGDACDPDDDSDGALDVDDCDPLNPDVYPGAEEVCNGIDDDCVAGVDDGLGDLTCGVGECLVTIAFCINGQEQVCVPGDPADEVCDGLDNDCDGEADEELPDLTCGVGECAATVAACVDGQEQVCVPGDPVDEVCDGLDNDCDGESDEESTDCTNYYLDVDGDSYGIEEMLCMCAPMDDYTALMAGDCNDADQAVNPAATELCADAIDNDCNPETTCNELQQGGEKYVIDTYKGEDPVDDFFSYGSPVGSSFNTGFEESNTAVVMLYREPDGLTYLAVILDAAADGSGGSATADFNGLFGAGLVVSDDANEASAVDPITGTASASWAWAPCCTDGVIYGPLDCAADGYNITVKFKSLTGIDQVVVLDGMGGSVTMADPLKPIILKGTVDPGPGVPESAHASCKAILDAGEAAGNGTYWIDPDGDGGELPFQVFCDMITDGGGWTMCGKFDRDNAWGEGSLPVGWGRSAIFSETMRGIDRFCAQGASLDCRRFISDGATQLLTAATDSDVAKAWTAGRIIDLPAEIAADPVNLWNVELDEGGDDVCTADAVITRNLQGVDIGINDGGANLIERAAILGDGAFFTNAGRDGAAFSNAGYATGQNACYGTGNDTVYWAWPDADGVEDDHGCGGSNGYLQLGTGCGQGNNWAGKPTYRYNLLLVR